MNSPQPTSKRKRNFLHPGEWRGKRARSGSRSGSPTDSGASSPGPSYSHGATQTPPNHDSVPSTGGGQQQPSRTSSDIPDNAAPGPQATAQRAPGGAVGATSTTNTNGISWTRLGKALQALRISTKIIPHLHSAIDGLKPLLHVFEEAARQRKEYDELATGLTAMVELLDKHLPDAASNEIKETIANISEKIAKEIESVNKRLSRGGTRQVLEGSGDGEDLIRCYRRIEQLFRQLQGEASMSSWNVASKHLIDTQLEKLRPVKLACFDSEISMDIGRRSCTENTRTKILGDSVAWADNPGGAKIYWMNGMAGTGKTTIAYSLCEELAATGQLAASFFCTRTSHECREAKRIIPTIAYQLARCSTPFRHALCGVLDKDPDIGTRIVSTQFELIIARPLQMAKDNMANNLVVVIDALDECSDP
ncbi:hypothetical protein FRC11_002545, partial [Ceratobasidium sp. 423]